MFYSQDILQKRGGRFGVIWIAATSAKHLTRREFCSVNLVKTCDDIVDIIYMRAPSRRQGGAKPRLSLYLSAQLMYGVLKVYSRQREYLFADVSAMSTKFRLATATNTDIDLQIYPRRDIVTNPDLAALSSRVGPGYDHTFGKFNVKEDIHFDIIPEMEMWNIHPSPEVLSPLGSSIRRELLPGLIHQPVSGSPHTVSSSDITMVEEIDQPEPLPVELELPSMNAEQLQMLERTALGMGTLESMLSPRPAVSTPIQQPSQTLIHREVLPPLEETPIVDNGFLSVIEVPERARRGRQASPGITPVIEQKRHSSKRKRNSITMELSPYVTSSPPSGSRKRRRLFTDKETKITKSVQKKNFGTGENTCRPFELPLVGHQSVSQLFARPGRKELKHPLLLGLFERNTVSRPATESDVDRRHPLWALPDLSVSSGTHSETENQVRAEVTDDTSRMQIEMGLPSPVPIRQSVSSEHSIMSMSQDTQKRLLQESLEGSHHTPNKRRKGPVGGSSEDEGQDFSYEHPSLIVSYPELPRDLSQPLFSVPEIQEQQEGLQPGPEEISDTEESLISSILTLTRVERWTTFKAICPLQTPKPRVARIFTKFLEFCAARKLKCKQNQPYGDIHLARGPQW